MKTNHKLALILVVGVAGYVGFQNFDLLRTPAKEEDPTLLLDRVWMESNPGNPTDYVHGAFFLSRPTIGLFQRGSAYDAHFEQFEYKRDGSKVSLLFPQTNRSAEITVHITKCSSLPPFDLCLDVAENPWGGPKRYYGLTEHEDEARVLGRAGVALRSHVPAQ